MRQPDEVWISVELAQEVLAKGYHVDKRIDVTNGPDPEARIIAVEYRPFIGMIVIKYDRPVPEPSFQETQAVATSYNRGDKP